MKSHRQPSRLFRRARICAVAVSLATILGTMLFLPNGHARGIAVAADLGGGYSARTLAAKGDADMAAHHPGRAILDYERARLLAPRSSAVAAALAQARASIGLPPVDNGHLAGALRRLSPNEWSWLALGGLGLAAIAVVAASFSARLRRTVLGAFMLGAAAAALGTVAAVRIAPSAQSAVVVGSDVVARIAPFAAAEPAFVAAEGAHVTVERTRSGFAWIRGESGEGWVPVDQIETILPAWRRPS